MLHATTAADVTPPFAAANGVSITLLLYCGWCRAGAGVVV